MTDANRPTEAVNISRDPYGLSKLRRAFEESQHRTGMVVGLPKVTIDASHVNHALVYIDALREEIQHLRSSAGARVEQDAARYQFLRGLHDPGPNDPRVHTLDQQHDPVQVRLCYGDDLDAVVDAAMRQP